MEQKELSVSVEGGNVPATPDDLIQLAIRSGTPIEHLERLMAMRREINADEARAAYDRDMAKLQSAMPVIKKRKSVKDRNGRELYKFAPLDDIVAQVGKLIADHGFSYSTKTEVLPGKVVSTTVVKHVSGHSCEYPVEMPLGAGTDIMSAPQKVAATKSFAKRYSFCDGFGIMTGDEDNDAVETEPPASATSQRNHGKSPAGHDGTYDVVIEVVEIRKGKMANGKRKDAVVTSTGRELVSWQATTPYLTSDGKFRVRIRESEYRGNKEYTIVRVIENLDPKREEAEYADEYQDEYD